MHSFTSSSPIRGPIDGIQNPSNLQADNYKLAYPNGPICVLEPNLYLYSEPTFEELSPFDVIINVAQEIKDFSKQVENHPSYSISYYFIPWTHTSRLTSDFPRLTDIIDGALKQGQSVLIHCQCGVSRSASLVMAYFMKYYQFGYNDAYKKLKAIVPQISPNLSLIYELIEWGEWLEKGEIRNSDQE
jgi:tyrosine-protein phosphatase MSG5